jgi:hypothetical protein
LILDINVFLDERWANDLVDIANGLGNTLSSPLSLISITELNGLVLTWFSIPISLVFVSLYSMSSTYQ